MRNSFPTSKRKLLPVAVVAGGAFILSVVGCGQSDLVPFHGQVSYKGKPLEFGSIMLQPVEGGVASRADIQPDGSYSLRTTDGVEGATIGLNRVRVACFSSQNPNAKPSPTDGESSLGRSLIPEHYGNFSSSGLTIEVLPADNPPYVIDLTD